MCLWVQVFSFEILYKTVQDYIHRVGRTARAGRSGVAISLVNQYELEWYIQIEKLIGTWHLLYSLEGVRDFRKVPNIHYIYLPCSRKKVTRVSCRRRRCSPTIAACHRSKKNISDGIFY